MKCIHCGSDTTYPVRRSTGKCGKCQHPFAFEPKTDPLKVTDGLFEKIIKGVSSDGKLWYTEFQLWYEFNRRAVKPRPSCGASSLAWLMLLPAAQSVMHKHMLAAAMFCVPVLAMAAPKPPPKPGAKPAVPRYATLSLAQFRTDYLAKWTNAHGRPDKMMPPVVRQAPANAFGRAEEFSSFSFDRVLVTQTAEIAAMLVANNFHFENNCAILSADGYPFDRFAAVLEMLHRNPNLKVFTIHDASLLNSKMASTLRAPNWFPDPSIKIIDLGIRPLHAQKSGMILLKSTPAAPGSQTSSSSSSGLTGDELTWLAAGNVAQVDNVKPAKLMRAIYQGFARASQVVADGSDMYDDSGMMIWVYDPGIDIYAADSFG